ncbi:hypothetical protein QZH41_015702, partial [Actinostola sp. cb2023]
LRPEYPVLLISMDGFKDVYIDRGFAPNIQKLAKEGVRARFLVPQFPTKTFPNHYSIITGLYPVHSGIVSNSFYDPELKDMFKIGRPTSFDPKWWKGEPSSLLLRSRKAEQQTIIDGFPVSDMVEWVLGTLLTVEYFDLWISFVNDDFVTVVLLLWQTAMKNGLVAASYFFVGSEIPIEGMLPNFTYMYNQSHPFETRVDKVLSWLDLPRQGSDIDPEKDDGKRRPDLITLYFHQPDKAGHWFGPDSEQVDNSTRYVDQMIGRLYEGLNVRSLMNKVNVIMLADHGKSGMAATDCKKITYLDEYGVSLDDIMTAETYGGAFMSLSPKPGGSRKCHDIPSNLFNNFQISIYFILLVSSVNKSEIISRIQCRSRYLRVFAKEQLPKRLHYSSSRRIGDIVVIPLDGWLVGTNVILFSSSGICKTVLGSHGYDPMDISMRAIFVAHGPSFKKGLVHDHFQNTEIYNMIAGLLRIEPAPNDGMPGSLHYMLNTSTEVPGLTIKGDGDIFENCSYPGRSIASARRKCKLCVCPYCDLGRNPDAVEHLDDLLDITKEQSKQSLDYLITYALLLLIPFVVSHFQGHNLPWGLPQEGAGKGGCVLTQQEYITGFSTYLRVPLWVGYRLDGEKAQQSIPRQNCFRRDIRLDDAQASTCTNYYKSGMDRGHMAPKADFDYNATAALNTFLLSNVAPQYHIFNIGDWGSIENYVRDLAINLTTIYVITGSIFDEDADGLRDKDESVTRWIKDQEHTVAIPTHFYKIIVRCDNTKQPYYKVHGCDGRLDVISFILPHNKLARCRFQTFKEYLLFNTATVRDIERLTGSVFLSGLPSLEQARLKIIYPVKLWL